MRKLSSTPIAIAIVSVLFFVETTLGADLATLRAKAAIAKRYRGPVFVGPATVGTQWTVKNLCTAYNYPKNLTGGTVIGIAEFGGGYTQTDLNLFSSTYMNGTPLNVQAISVNGGTNSPGVDSDVDAEVALDIQIAGAAYYYCTGKSPTIKVFFCDPGNTNDSFVNANAAVYAAAAAAGCDVLSVSWGIDENFVSHSVALALEAAATSATSKGTAIFVASGDGNGTDERGGETDGENHVSVLAACPHVIAVGGTTKLLNSEYVWNNGFSLGTPYPLGTGGGYSTIFPIQSYQIGAPKALLGNNGTGRMVPDVAANADPITPYLIAFEGSIQAAGNGTSAATPLWAGLVASFKPKPGYIAPTLWATANRKAFTDITLGNNDSFQALTGPDAATGLGVPNGAVLASLFAPSPVTPVASAVTATYVSGTLTVTGDSGGNSVTVSIQGSSVKVEGANGTKVNGAAAFSSPHTGLLKVIANMNGGDDAIAFVGINSSTTDVNLGDGNDKAAFTLCTVATLTIDGGAGTDTLLTTSSTFTHPPVESRIP